MNAAQSPHIYALEDRPPLASRFVLAAQHVLIAIVDLTMPVLVVRAMGGTIAQTIWMVQISLVAIALGTLLQCRNKGLGSGYLLPHSTTSLYLAPSLLAAQCGGAALVAGMTAIAGGFHICFAQWFRRCRSFFPPHLPGLILAVNGWVALLAGLPLLVGWTGDGGAIDGRIPVIGLTTLIVILGLLVSGGGRLRLYALVIGVVYGYCISHLLYLGGGDGFTASQSMPLFMLPNWRHAGFDFDAALLGPFLCAALAAGMKGSGLITKAHQINGITSPVDRQRRLRMGLLADGAGCLFSSLLGGYGTAISASNLGVSIASKATSRRLGYWVAALFLLLAVLPKFTALLSAMPSPVMGVMLVCIGINMMQIGMRLVQITPLRKPHLLTMGLPIGLGLWFGIASPSLSSMPLWLSSLLSNAISVTTLAAFVLHHLCDSLPHLLCRLCRQRRIPSMEQLMAPGQSVSRLLSADNKVDTRQPKAREDPPAGVGHRTRWQAKARFTARCSRQRVDRPHDRLVKKERYPKWLQHSKGDTPCKNTIVVIDSCQLLPSSA